MFGYARQELSKLDFLDLYLPQNVKHHSSVISFNIKDIFAQDVAAYFNKNKIAIRTGNHCAKMICDIIGVNESIRASFYVYNTKEEGETVTVHRDTVHPINAEVRAMFEEEILKAYNEAE